MSRCTFQVASCHFDDYQSWPTYTRYVIWSKDEEIVQGFMELSSQYRASSLQASWNPQATFENVTQFDRDAARAKIKSQGMFIEHGKWIDNSRGGIKLKPTVGGVLNNAILVDLTLNDVDVTMNESTLINPTLINSTLVNSTLVNPHVTNTTLVTNITFNSNPSLVVLGNEVIFKGYFEMSEEEIRSNFVNPFNFIVYAAPQMLWFCDETPEQNILSKNSSGDIFVKLTSTTRRKTDAKELWSILIAHFETLVQHLRTLGLSPFEEYMMRGVIELGKKGKLIKVVRESPVHRAISNYYAEQCGTYNPKEMHIDLVDSIGNCIDQSVKRGRMLTFEEIKRNEISSL